MLRSSLYILALYPALVFSQSSVDMLKGVWAAQQKSNDRYGDRERPSKVQIYSTDSVDTEVVYGRDEQGLFDHFFEQDACRLKIMEPCTTYNVHFSFVVFADGRTVELRSIIDPCQELEEYVWCLFKSLTMNSPVTKDDVSAQ